MSAIPGVMVRGDGRRGRLVLVSWCALLGCGPSLDAPGRDAAGEDAGSGTTTVTMTAEASTTGPSEEASRFFGVFHYHHGYFGGVFVDDGDVPPLWPPLVNVEIRPDGTAGMLLESCVPLFGAGPLEVEWRWELGQDGWLELRPGPGESSLRFMEPTELVSLRATIDDQCDMRFEADGELLTNVFLPGRACWFDRCESPWRMSVVYCEGEEPVGGCELAPAAKR